MKKSKPIAPGLKKLIRESFRKHAWNLGVSHWEADIHYMDDPSERDTKREGTTAMEVDVDRRYIKAIIKVFPRVHQDMWHDRDYRAIDQAVAHEISHILTQHMFDLAVSCYKDEGETKDAWESLTESIARLSCKIKELEEHKGKRRRKRK